MHTIVSKARNLSAGFHALIGSFGLFGMVAMLVCPRLPAHMAWHFSGSGRTNGYQSPAVDLVLLVGACITFVLVFGVGWYGLRQLDPAMMNLPDTPRWRDPAERAALRDQLADSMLWLAAASVTLMAGLLHSLYRANLPGAHGTGPEFWVYLFVYVVFMLVWPLLQLPSLFESEAQPKNSG